MSWGGDDDDIVFIEEIKNTTTKQRQPLSSLPEYFNSKHANSTKKLQGVNKFSELTLASPKIVNTKKVSKYEPLTDKELVKLDSDSDSSCQQVLLNSLKSPLKHESKQPFVSITKNEYKPSFKPELFDYKPSVFPPVIDTYTKSKHGKHGLPNKGNEEVIVGSQNF